MFDKITRSKQVCQLLLSLIVGSLRQIPASNAGGAPDRPAVDSFSAGVVSLSLWLKQKPDCQATVP